MQISNPDRVWLIQAVELLKAVHSDAPELFSESDEEILLIALEIKEKMEL